MAYQEDLHKIIEVRHLTESTFVLRIEKKGLEFEAGQHVSLGPEKGIHTREYSIYSAPKDDYIEVLVKEVLEGLVSPALKKVKAGDLIRVGEPVGYFTISEEDKTKNKFLFIASGTGISPFNAFIKDMPNINYRLLHGVRNSTEAYEQDRYEKGKYVLCTSRDGSGDFFGRVTNYLQEAQIDSDTSCYLCGNCNMIHDAYDILQEKGISPENIHAEVYF